jgi:hypothetical protein
MMNKRKNTPEQRLQQYRGAVLEKYGATSAISPWTLEVRCMGQVIATYPNLTYEACKNLYYREEVLDNQVALVYLNGQRLKTIEKWRMFYDKKRYGNQAI